MAFGVPLNDKVQVNDIMSVRETAGHLIEGIDGRTRAFVQVQNGCDHRCTFCIIPYGRGPSRSVPMGAVVEQIKRLVAQRLPRGGADRRRYHVVWARPAGAADARQAGAGDPAPRAGPAAAAASRRSTRSRRTRRCYEAIASDRAADAAPASVSLQSGDDMILKRMKRRHLRADTLAFVEQACAPRGRTWCSAPIIIAGLPDRDRRRCSRTR